MCDPRIYKWISDDSSETIENFEPVIVDEIYYLGCFDGEKYLGLFMVVPQSFAWFDFHTCLLADAWGNAVECVDSAKKWIFENTRCIRLTTIVPENNRLALRLAKKSGAIEYGFNPKCWVKNGVVCGVHLLGISKE